MGKINQSIERIIADDNSNLAEGQILALQMKIIGPHLDITKYKQLSTNHHDDLTIQYMIGRLTLKYCNYNLEFMLISNRSLDRVINSTQVQRDERQLGMVFYQKVIFFRLQQLHKRPLLIIQNLCVIFKQYGLPFAHKVKDMQLYYNDCVKANNLF